MPPTTLPQLWVTCTTALGLLLVDGWSITVMWPEMLAADAVHTNSVLGLMPRLSSAARRLGSGPMWLVPVCAVPVDVSRVRIDEVDATPRPCAMRAPWTSATALTTIGDALDVPLNVLL